MAPEAASVVAEFYSEYQTKLGVLSRIQRLCQCQRRTPRTTRTLCSSVKCMLLASATWTVSGRRTSTPTSWCATLKPGAVPTQLSAVKEIDIALVGQWEDAVAHPATTPTVDRYEDSARTLVCARDGCNADHATTTGPPCPTVAHARADAWDSFGGRTRRMGARLACSRRPTRERPDSAGSRCGRERGERHRRRIHGGTFLWLHRPWRRERRDLQAEGQMA